MAEQDTANMVTETENAMNVNAQENEETTTLGNDSAELAKVKSDLARMKIALDNATKEAGNYRKQLRARQTAEEAAAEAEKERQEAMEKELADLRKERDVGRISKRIMMISSEIAMTLP